MNEIEWVKIPLPDDVLRQKTAGYMEEAGRTIDGLLAGYLPECMRKRLEVEKEIISLLNEKEYPYDRAAALEILRHSIRDFKDEELDELIASRAADWIYLNGELHFHKRFLENITNTRREYDERQITKDDNDAGDSRRKMLDDNVEYMEKHGGRTAEITVQASLRITRDAQRVGEKVRVHLPIPRASRQNSQIRILESSQEITSVAPEDALQRTICFETVLKPDQEFRVRYSYVNHVDYVVPDPSLAVEVKASDILKDSDRGGKRAEEYLCEQAPHILFTPFMKELLSEICGEEKNPTVKARQIYDFITTKVKYSYVRAYAALDNISEYAAKNLKGDCGVQAILFITLCRLAGIPARWQSGLYVTSRYTGCHDWAEFYLEPYGWLYADLSFGGSAYRTGKEKRWNYYFGNLDIYRMAANGEMQSELNPPKIFFRADPVDNQVGEVEYQDGGLTTVQLETEQTAISIKDME